MHYFDCSQYNEADRFMNTKKSIPQYLGQKYGAYVKVTLATGIMFVVHVPHDPAKDYEDSEDEKGTTTETENQKVPYVDEKTFKKEIAGYVKR